MVENVEAVKQPFRRTRFAPSPTGYLHLGHLVHGLFVWALARETKARVLLRMEDHDGGRCREAYEEAIRADLAWLGLVPDEGLALASVPEPSPFRQSDCGAVYAAAFARLADAGAAYGCRCSRREILARTGQQDGELRYDNHCRHLGIAPAEGTTWRVALPDTAVRFSDHLCGVQTQAPAQETGDLVLRDRNGYWSYHFCVVVDDLRHGVDWIIRGEDLLASTGRQMLLAELLGGDVPFAYAHHPLLTAPDGRKLSKRDFDAPLAVHRKDGAPPERLLGDALHALGLAEKPVATGLDDALAAIGEHWASGTFAR